MDPLLNSNAAVLNSIHREDNRANMVITRRKREQQSGRSKGAKVAGQRMGKCGVVSEIKIRKNPMNGLYVALLGG